MPPTDGSPTSFPQVKGRLSKGGKSDNPLLDPLLLVVDGVGRSSRVPAAPAAGRVESSGDAGRPEAGVVGWGRAPGPGAGVLVDGGRAVSRLGDRPLAVFVGQAVSLVP